MPTDEEDRTACPSHANEGKPMRRCLHWRYAGGLAAHFGVSLPRMSDAVKNLASLAHLLSNEGLDELDDFVLLTAWETRNLFEDLLHATDRTVAAFWDNV